jgi:hypothetical protein
MGYLERALVLPPCEQICITSTYILLKQFSQSRNAATALNDN